MIHPLFSIPLYINFECSKEYNINLNDVNTKLKNLKWERVQNPNPLYEPKGSTTVNKEILKLPEFLDISKIIENEIKKYLFRDLCIDPDGIELSCNRSWSMLHKKGDYSREHCHDNCLWSGIFYTKLPSNCGGLTFHCEPSRYTWILPAIKPRLKKITPHTSNEVYIEPTEGCIVIFPGFLLHSTPRNLNNDDRMNIVFNYSLKGEFGDNYYEKQIIN